MTRMMADGLGRVIMKMGYLRCVISSRGFVTCLKRIFNLSAVLSQFFLFDFQNILLSSCSLKFSETSVESSTSF